MRMRDRLASQGAVVLLLVLAGCNATDVAVVRLKPDPTSALHISRRLNTLPAEFIYLGDSGVDMKTAAAAGMYPVGALWGLRTSDELLACGAKQLIQNPTDLPNLL